MLSPICAATKLVLYNDFDGSWPHDLLRDRQMLFQLSYEAKVLFALQIQILIRPSPNLRESGVLVYV